MSSGNVETTWHKTGPEDRFLGKVSEKANITESELDTPDMEHNHARLMGQYLHELEAQSDNRAEMERDEDYYDHVQWTAEDAKTLEERGQMPLVFNLIHTSVNWLLGSERRSRMDYKILPRRKTGAKAAESKTAYLKYLSDVNHSRMHNSRAFAEAIKAGVGWLETGYQEDDDGEPVYDRAESWRNVLHDSASTELDYSDARYIFRTRWTDVDLATALFPKRKGMIEMSTTSTLSTSSHFDVHGDEPMDSQEEAHFDSIDYWNAQALNYRDRVRLIEAWFRMPVEAQWMKGGQFSGEVFDEYSPGHARDLNEGFATIVTKVKMRMHVAIMTTHGLIYHGPSIYRHNRFPLTPIWGNRRARDGMPYGYIRGLRDPQADLNKRASKALYLLSVRRAFVPKDSIEDMDEFREEAARPDAIIEYDAIASGGVPPNIESETNLAAAHIDLMERDAQMIQMTGGVTDENLGRETNASSGRAIIARQDQGALATSGYFDNYRHARLIHGEKQLINIEQFVTDEREFRISNERGNAVHHKVNGQPTPEDEDDPVNIAEFKADFIIEEDDWRQSVRQANTAALMEVLQQLAPAAPNIVMLILDLVVEAMDIPKREEIVKRIRQATGLPDPDADPENPTPEMLAMAEKKQKEEAMQDRAAQAELATIEARAADLMAKAQKTQAETDRLAAGKANEALTMIKTAIEAANLLMPGPGAAPVADQLMMEADQRAGTPVQPTPNAPILEHEGTMQ